MLKIEQTEFWTETTASRLRSTAAPVPSAVEDYFLDDEVEPEPTLDRSTDLAASIGDVEALEAIVVQDEDDSSGLFDVSESIDSIERRRREASEAAKVAPEPVSVEPARPRGTIARPTYAQQDAPSPRYNMTRLLRLTGSLDAVDDRQHWYDLPARGFRALFTMAGRRKTISGDFIKDLQAAPRGVTLRKYRLPDRWAKFK